ncbi:MAG: prepilin-type N-terminal cleavage/methylation domain-containing protein [Gammaproteobacteria bacterium]|nr:prepilin-type N-terminal cleavage/methylation domain-containing protein [Gammaproteobacteria bacterium]
MILKKETGANSGFTLAELIMVIGMIAILSAIAVPNIIASLPDYRLRSATRDIVSCLQEAKLRAVKEGANTAMIFDIANDKYTAWVDNGWGGGAGNWWPDTNVGEVIFKQINLPNDISLYQNTTFNLNTFGFNSRGFPATNVGTIFIKNNQSHYRKIIVNSPGNIRVQKSSDGATWN